MRTQFTLSALLAVIVPFACVGPATAAEAKVFNVRDYGALGDGQTMDTAAINKAIEACSTAGGGRVDLPAGNYLSGTVRLRSDVDLHLQAGATLLGSSDLKDYENLVPPGMMPESKALAWHRALVLADGARNISISGPGAIDGRKVFDAHGEEHIRGPHTVLLGSCRNVTIREISIKDSANYAILLELTDNVAIRNVKITGGWDGVHFRGCREQPCRDVTIAGCRFFTGDDSIAGRYWDRVRISDCVLNSSCNCVRLIGPAAPPDHREMPHVRTRRASAPQLEPPQLPGRIQPPARRVGRHTRRARRRDHQRHRDAEGGDALSFRPQAGQHGGADHRQPREGHGRVFHGGLRGELGGDALQRRDLPRREHRVRRGRKTRGIQAGGACAGNDCRPLPAWGFYLRNVQNLTMANVRLTCQKDALRARC